MDSIAQKRVIIFGVGGVGSWCAESLVRSGIRHLTIVDSDRVAVTNINRQIFATRSTVGQYKVDVARARILDVNPDCQVRIYKTFYMPDTKDEFDFTQYDYVVDAIDSVSSKVALILLAQSLGVSPTDALNTWEKYSGSRKPTAKATSLTEKAPC